jgi:hypothetical protein
MILSQMKGAVGDPRQKNARTDYLSHRASCSYLLGVVTQNGYLETVTSQRRQNPEWRTRRMNSKRT